MFCDEPLHMMGGYRPLLDATRSAQTREFNDTQESEITSEQSRVVNCVILSTLTCRFSV